MSYSNSAADQILGRSLREALAQFRGAYAVGDALTARAAAAKVVDELLASDQAQGTYLPRHASAAPEAAAIAAGVDDDWTYAEPAGLGVATAGDGHSDGGYPEVDMSSPYPPGVMTIVDDYEAPAGGVSNYVTA